MTTERSTAELVEDLRKRASVVYLATEAVVAKDLDHHLRIAADRLEAQAARITELEDRLTHSVDGARRDDLDARGIGI